MPASGEIRCRVSQKPLTVEDVEKSSGFETPPRCASGEALPKKENRSSPRPPRLEALDLLWNARVGRDPLSRVTKAFNRGGRGEELGFEAPPRCASRQALPKKRTALLHALHG